MYACSPSWRADWLDKNDLHRVLVQLAGYMKRRYSSGLDRVGLNQGLHFTGGEPFLNYELLLDATHQAHTLGIPGVFVETNCFWCHDDQKTRDWLNQLKMAGLEGILISVNPFILEHVPFERTRRAIKIGSEIFKKNVLIYQEIFYQQFIALNLTKTYQFEEYLSLAPSDSLRYVELLPMGRSVYKLNHLFKRFPVERFFGESCQEELTRDWHVHFDNYWNYIPGYCGGLSLGDVRALDSLVKDGINLDSRPILKALTEDIRNLYNLAVHQYGYKKLSKGYISKCHLCLDIRRSIIGKTNRFKELQPRQFYLNLKR